VSNDTAATLARVPLLTGLKKRDLSGLAKRFREHTFRAGDDVTVEGRTGAGFFIVADGRATVRVGERTVSSLGPGDYFGDVALIDSGPRSATITAETDLRCLGITPWEFKPFVKEHPEVAWTLLVALAARLRDAESRA